MIQTKVFILSVTFFLVCQSSNGQGNTGDSLRKELTFHNNADSNRVKALIALGYYLMEKKSDSAYLCAKESIELAKKLKWNQGLANGEILLSSYYVSNNQLDSSVSLLVNALKIAEDLYDARIMAKAHWHISVSYYHMKYNDRAEYHALKSLEFANVTKDEPQMLETFWLLGVLYTEQRKWREAEKYYNLAMPMAKK